MDFKIRILEPEMVLGKMDLCLVLMECFDVKKS